MVLLKYNKDITIERDDIGWYYQYIIKLISNYYSGYKDICLGKCMPTVSNLLVDVQWEHTIVDSLYMKSSYKSMYNVLNTNRNYIIRIDNLGYYSKLDYIIEYSIPNYMNIKSNNLLSGIVGKVLVIHPCILDSNNFISDNRRGIITSFSNLENNRRYFIYDGLKKLFGLEYYNMNEYNMNEQIKIYNNTKVMVNIHQTDYHHTFEEFRVLPVLQSGVIIVSEDSPLKEHIPYSEYIIWSSYDKIHETVIDVMNNYEYYYNKIFNADLLDIINTMREDNIKNIKKII